jgi:hypothetical protein
VPDLVLGPVLRYTSETEACVWVETDAPGEVEVLGATAPTFTVHGHHYALVVIEGLEPGSRHEYQVRVDGEVRWPEAGSDLPPSVIRTVDPDRPLTIAFGSCRIAAPHEEPWTLTKDEDEERGFEHDALRVLAREMSSGDRDNWPEVLFLIGDQVYVDLGSPETRAFLRSRRHERGDAPDDEVVDFIEYTRLYHEAWSDPLLRWLLSTISVAMVWDDHDMGDDWNISAAWIEEMGRHDWWHRRKVAGFAAYWIHQHLGNLSPGELGENDVWQDVRGGGDVTSVVEDFAKRAGEHADGVRWSYSRDFGRTRLVVMETRASRDFSGEQRLIIDDETWAWIVDHATGDVDHLLLATSDPYLLAPAMHEVEAWSERVCDGAWGRWMALRGEKLRRDIDFDHWGSFTESFGRLAELLREVGSGRRGAPPASIVVLSGDVHHAYAAAVDFGADAGVTSAVYQAVCSPLRNPLVARERWVVRFGASRVGHLVGRCLRRLAGGRPPPITWELCDGPIFDNQVGTVRIDGWKLEIRLDKTVPGEHEERRLERVMERAVTPT